VIEPSHGEERVSGPGRSLMAGLVATSVLILTFLIGFQLGRNDERTIVAEASATPSVSRADAAISRIQVAAVDHNLQQAYYNHAGHTGWVVCQDAAGLLCAPATYETLDVGAFRPATENWRLLKPIRLSPAARTYLMFDFSASTWIADLAEPAHYRRVVGVSLNGTVEYFDLGPLAVGRYVVISRATNAFSKAGPITLGIGLDVQ
jgi:hypothetical protein